MRVLSESVAGELIDIGTGTLVRARAGACASRSLFLRWFSSRAFKATWYVVLSLNSGNGKPSRKKSSPVNPGTEALYDPRSESSFSVDNLDAGDADDDGGACAGLAVESPSPLC